MSSLKGSSDFDEEATPLQSQIPSESAAGTSTVNTAVESINQVLDISVTLINRFAFTVLG